MLDIGPLQLEALGHLWDHGPQTVLQVHERLNAVRQKPIAYTTTLTILRNLHRRVLVTRVMEKTARGHIYASAVPRVEFQARLVESFVSVVFQGDKTKLIALL